MQIDQETYDRIAAEISCENSPVGIDAKKTHILILHKLGAIEARLEKIESRLKTVENSAS